MSLYAHFLRQCHFLVQMVLLQEFIKLVREFAAQVDDEDVASEFEADADVLASQNSGLVQQIQGIGDILLKLRGQKNALELILDCIDARDYLEEVPHEMLKKKASEYFSKKFPEAEIKFSYKKDGRQLGDCIHILQSGYSEIIYHIKTHSYCLCADLEALDSHE